ncbi:MAG: alanine racemase [Acidimicrobiales bacterium]
MAEAAPTPSPTLSPGERSALRPVWAEVDLEAVRHNAGLLSRIAAPAALCVVVKADAYGHGAEPVARAALQGGATWLAVALVEEGIALRQAGISAPVLVLSEAPPDALEAVVANGLTPTVYTRAGVRALSDAADAARRVVGAHVKVDTGMHRVGADPADVAEVVGAVVAGPHLRFEGLYTHLAVADGIAYTSTQLLRFEEVRRSLTAAGLEAPVVHAANSAAAIAHPRARLGMVRCGIAVYGLLPSTELGPALAAAGDAVGGGRLRPVLSLRARVSLVRNLDEGERPSYGRRYPLPEPSVVATVPIGYADGVPRRHFPGGGTVLIGGRHRPLAGTVTMDQIMVDCGPDANADVRVGDEVVLIGTQGDASISAWDFARALDTIAYEVVCGIGPRVPRVFVDRPPGDSQIGAAPTVPNDGRRSEEER